MSKDDRTRKSLSRRGFLKKSVRSALMLIAGLFTLERIFGARGGNLIWQIDPSKCTQCGRCADFCVLAPSAVRCVHSYSICGYCELCFGYFRPTAREFTEAAHNQLCPTGAIERKFIEDPYYEYTINRELCIGCGRCVRGCGLFGNGSLYLQVNHDICVNCNKCRIAENCAADAFRRVPAAEPGIFKRKGGGE